VGDYDQGELILRNQSHTFKNNGHVLRYNSSNYQCMTAMAATDTSSKPEMFSFTLKKTKSVAPESIWLELTTMLYNGQIHIDKERILELKAIPVEQRPAMIKAILKELHSLVELGTFSLEPMPDNHKKIYLNAIF